MARLKSKNARLKPGLVHAEDRQVVHRRCRDDQQGPERMDAPVKHIGAGKEPADPQPGPPEQEIDRIEDGEEKGERLGLKRHFRSLAAALAARFLWDSRCLFHQNAEVRFHAVGQPVEVITSLQHGDKPAPARLLGDLADDPRQLGEALGGDFHPAQQVALVSVEAGRDQDQIGLERQRRRPQLLLKGPLVLAVARAGGQGDLSFVPRALPRPRSSALPVPG